MTRSRRNIPILRGPRRPDRTNERSEAILHKILISACLLGEPVRYDGNGKLLRDAQIEVWQRQGRLVPFCPEVEGGLGTPRPPAEVVGGSGRDVLAGRATVRTVAGDDVAAAFRLGAQRAVDLVRRAGIRIAILKARSPSCGNEEVYDGSHQRRLVPGVGVAAAALQQAGVRLFHEGQVEAAAGHLRELQEAEQEAPETPRH